MRDKLIQAYKDNHRELLEARKNGDFEEEIRCEGYENAMFFVMALHNIDTSLI